MSKRVMHDLIQLARRAEGHTRTNPMVAAGFVEDGELIASGYHRQYGGDHAEVDLFKSVDHSPVPSTLYCTLEPCLHRGKTDPCLNRIARSGVKRVVLAHEDPHPAVRGKGIEALRRLGITVEVGPGREPYRWVNRAYFHGVRTGSPWIDLKVAMSADGYIAPLSGDSRWITGEESRERGHRLRSKVDAVMVGANTVRQDDPRLTDRVTGSDRQPLAVVVSRDPSDLPADAHLFTERADRTILVVPPGKEDPEPFVNRGIRCLIARLDDGTFNWDQTLPGLRKMGIGRILVEGGGFLAGRLLEAGMVQELHLFHSGRVFGEGTRAFRMETPPYEVKESRCGQLLEQEAMGEDVYVRRLLEDDYREGFQQWAGTTNTVTSGGVE